MIASRRTWWLLALGIAGLALAASANSIGNGFAYDDVHLIVRNARRMHAMGGWWREFAHTYWPEYAGGDGYRPLTIIAFRLEWALGAGAPWVFHAVNVAVHVATAVLVFWLAGAILPVAAAWVAAALYAVHPVHVEAVANVVGQSELWVALLLTLAVGLYLHGRAAGALTRRRWGAIAGIYLVACLFKEHAIVLPALLLLAETTVVTDRASLRERFVRLRPALLVLVVVAAGYMLARSRVVVGGLSGFKPYIVFQALDLSTSDRVLTMVGVAPEWVRLFLWPQRLLTEYAPPRIDIAQGPSLSQLPGLLLLLGIIGLMIACWRRSPVTSFGIGWIVVSLLPASNFLVPAGFIIAERTLLLPSVGAVLALGSAVPWLYRRLEGRRMPQALAAAAVALLIGLGIARSVTRNPVWRDTETLFRQQVKDSPDSYRAHFMLGQLLFDNDKKAEGEMHYRTALRLFPYDPVMIFGLAEQYRKARMYEPAARFYRMLFELHPNFGQGHSAYAQSLLYTLKLDDARSQALQAIRGGENVAFARVILRAAAEARDSLAARRGRGETLSPAPPASAR